MPLRSIEHLPEGQSSKGRGLVARPIRPLNDRVASALSRHRLIRSRRRRRSTMSPEIQPERP